MGSIAIIAVTLFSITGIFDQSQTQTDNELVTTNVKVSLTQTETVAIPEKNIVNPTISKSTLISSLSNPISKSDIISPELEFILPMLFASAIPSGQNPVTVDTWTLSGATLSSSLATDSANNIYFINNNKIGRLNPSTNLVEEWEVPTTNSGVSDITIDSSNNVYFGEYTANKIGKLNPINNEFTEWTITGSNNIKEVETDSVGNVYYLEQGGNKISKLDPLTNAITEWVIDLPPTGHTGEPGIARLVVNSPDKVYVVIHAGMLEIDTTTNQALAFWIGDISYVQCGVGILATAPCHTHNSPSGVTISPDGLIGYYLGWSANFPGAYLFNPTTQQTTWIKSPSIGIAFDSSEKIYVKVPSAGGLGQVDISINLRTVWETPIVSEIVIDSLGQVIFLTDSSEITRFR